MQVPCTQVQTPSGMVFQAALTLDQLLEVCKGHDPEWPSPSNEIEPQLTGDREMVAVLVGKRWNFYYLQTALMLTLHPGDVSLELELFVRAQKARDEGHGGRLLQICFVREGDFYPGK